MSIEIGADKCSCPPEWCAKFVDPPSGCINRLEGDVRTLPCPVCHPDGDGATWHHNGVCLRCKHLEQYPQGPRV